jgi:predicted metal-dependent hydrolase
VVALLTCDTGEEVDRLTGTGPALLTYLADRNTSEDEPTVHPDRTENDPTVLRDRAENDPTVLRDRAENDPAGRRVRSENEAAVRPERSADDDAVRRDRDSAGRPRNSRPRDALGRPLAPGAPGIPTMPDDLEVTPAEALQQAQQLLDDGFPFHAHEVLEAAWKAAPDAERELWRGLAQLAVGLTHDRRGNTTGAARLLTRAAERIGPFAGAAPHGIDAAGLSAWARAAAADITADRPAPDGRIPRLTTDSAP